MSWSRASRERLSTHDLHRFTGDSLFDAVARVLCQANCLPRKELYESWEVARRVLRRHKGGRVLDLAGGHGLVAWLMTLLDRRTPAAVCVDRRLPDSAARLTVAFGERWPGVAARVSYLQADLDAVAVEADDRVLGIHACGALTDRVLDLAVAARARVAVLPCCHPHALDDGGLSGWMPTDLAIDATRAARVRAAGYTVHTATIPADITPKNRLLLGTPGVEPAPEPVWRPVPGLVG